MVRLGMPSQPRLPCVVPVTHLEGLQVITIKANSLPTFVRRLERERSGFSFTVSASLKEGMVVISHSNPDAAVLLKRIAVSL